MHEIVNKNLNGSDFTNIEIDFLSSIECVETMEVLKCSTGKKRHPSLNEDWRLELELKASQEELLPKSPGLEEEKSAVQNFDVELLVWRKSTTV